MNRERRTTEGTECWGLVPWFATTSPRANARFFSILLLFSIVLRPLLHAADRPPEDSFPIRILPILTKAGCNNGSCHGAVTGQGGFKLSLLGYDPEHDYQAITRELSGRRIDRAVPTESLILRKPTRELDHEGGRRIPRDSEDYRTLVTWLEQGALFGPSDLHVRAIRILAPDTLLLPPGRPVTLRVEAALSNGTMEDVTRHTLFSSNDDGIAEVDKDGSVTVLRPGVTAIMTRYAGQLAAVRAGAPFGDSPPAKPRFIPRNFIDRAAAAEWERFHLPPSPAADDLTFLRRIHLDLTGRLPTPDAIQAFHAHRSRHKRERIIDALLTSPEFVDYWTMKFADLLLINPKKLGPTAARVYHEWVRKQIAANTPLDHLVRDLLSTLGDPEVDGPANFARLTTDPRDMGEFVSQSFLGARIACARCHNHPVDRWTIDDYHQFAAYFARVGVEQGRVIVRSYGDIEHPKTGRPVTPQVLPTPALDPASSTRQSPQTTKAGSPDSPGTDPRTGLAAWLVASDNSLFARAWANRVWKELLGRGLVEPVDDLRGTNPASIPDLLDALAADLIKSGFDLRHLIREIARSSVYQLDSRFNAINQEDDRLFSHAYLKPLNGPVLADAITQALDVPELFEGQPRGTLAVQLIDPGTPSHTLEVFGRCPRIITCEPATERGGGLSQALHLISGPAINARLTEAAARLLAAAGSERDAVERAYLRVLSRSPTASESRTWIRMIRAGTSKQASLEDLLWALLNSREFALNH